MPKQGKEFENLVQWINDCLHDTAIVTPNARIKDITSGSLREVDISIQLKDGPSEFLGIIEVRDHSRPVGLPYIDEVANKAKSIRANSVTIVSRSGFVSKAYDKAKILGVKLITFSEALEHDWGVSLINLGTIEAKYFKYSDATIYFLKEDGRSIINPHPTILSELKDSKKKVFVDDSNHPFKSMDDLMEHAISKASKFLYSKLKIGINNKENIQLHIALPKSDPLFCQIETGDFERVYYLLVVGEMWIQIDSVPAIHRRYSEQGRDVLAESVSANLPTGSSVDIVVENPDFTDKPRMIHVRYKKI